MVGLTVISCSKDDDAGRTTDPLIGTWTLGDEDDSGTVVFNEDGTFTETWYYLADTQNPDTYSGTWRNNGSDFSSTIQIYTFNSEGIDDGEEETSGIIFTDDFNSWQLQEEQCSEAQGSDFCDDYENDIWYRQ